MYTQVFSHSCIPLHAVFELQALRKYHSSDFDEQLRPSAPVGFSFLEDAIELLIPIREAKCQGYAIKVGVSPYVVSMYPRH